MEIAVNQLAARCNEHLVAGMVHEAKKTVVNKQQQEAGYDCTAIVMPHFPQSGDRMPPGRGNGSEKPTSSVLQTTDPNFPWIQNSTSKPSTDSAWSGGGNGSMLGNGRKDMFVMIVIPLGSILVLGHQISLPGEKEPRHRLVQRIGEKEANSQQQVTTAAWMRSRWPPQATPASYHSAVHSTKKGCESIVPFPVQVALMMMIPILFIVGYSAITFAEADKTLRYLKSVDDLLLAMEQCEDSLMLERGITTVALTDNTSAVWTKVRNAREVTSTRCENVHQLSLQQSKGRVAKYGFTLEVTTKLSELMVHRFKVNVGHQTTFLWRDFMTSFVLLMDAGRTDIITDKAISRFMVLKVTRLAANYLGTCRAVGAELLGTPQANTTFSLTGEFVNCRNTYSFKSTPVTRLSRSTL